MLYRKGQFVYNICVLFSRNDSSNITIIHVNVNDRTLENNILSCYWLEKSPIFVVYDGNIERHCF